MEYQMFNTEDLEFDLSRDKEEGYRDIKFIIKDCPYISANFQEYYDLNFIARKLWYFIMKKDEHYSQSFYYRVFTIARNYDYTQLLLPVPEDRDKDHEEEPISVRILDKVCHIVVSKFHIISLLNVLYSDYPDFFVPSFFSNVVNYRSDGFDLDLAKERRYKGLCKIVFNKDNVEYYWYEENDMVSMKVTKGDNKDE